MSKLSNVLWGGDKPGKATTLGIQHVFAMFGSTVLVPALTGLDASVTLLSMGIGTLIFHLCTKGIVPAFMGSSFSFIAAICSVMASTGGNAAYVGWGIMASGLLYLILSGIVKIFGAKKVTNFFPPVVTGCMIIIIGMMLAPTAMNNVTTVHGDVPANATVVVVEGDPATDEYVLCDYNYDADHPANIVSGYIKSDKLVLKEDCPADDYNHVAAYVNEGSDYIVLDAKGVSMRTEADAASATVSGTAKWKNWVVAIFTILVIVLVMFFVRGFFKLIPILIGIVAGYVLSICLGMVDFSAVVNARWFDLPKFNFFFTGSDWGLIGSAIIMIAPISIVTFVEHVGDISANGAVTGHNYIEEPGLHRTLLGCGLASIVSGAFGGPAATTYSENTGVLAATKNYNPATLRIAALFAILLAFVGKVSGVLQTIPAPVMGGVSVILFGMISSVGLRMLVENGVDFTKSYNLIIAGIMLVFGLGLANGITFGANEFGEGGFTISGTAIAAVLGIILAKVLPKKDADERAEEKANAAAKAE